MDRRVKYTRMVLNESLIRFLESKDIAKITVTQICKDADINRSTYYAHFTDPFDQLAQLKAELLNDVAEYTQRIDLRQIPAIKRTYLVLKNLLEYVESKRHIFRILLEKSGDHNLQHEILRILGEKAFAMDEEPELSEDERNYRMIYASNGCFGMFYHWLMSETPISCDQLARMMAAFAQPAANLVPGS